MRCSITNAAAVTGSKRLIQKDIFNRAVTSLITWPLAAPLQDRQTDQYTLIISWIYPAERLTDDQQLSDLITKKILSIKYKRNLNLFRLLPSLRKLNKTNQCEFIEM
jgi:hypothetical protein